MTADEFNEKWKDHLEKGHYGMNLEGNGICELVDNAFTKLLETNPKFTYSQIKEKFGSSRVYMQNTPAQFENDLELEINLLL